MQVSFLPHAWYSSSWQQQPHKSPLYRQEQVAAAMGGNTFCEALRLSWLMVLFLIPLPPDQTRGYTSVLGIYLTFPESIPAVVEMSAA